MHSHKCANPDCPGKINGVPVIWHHSSAMQGNLEAHQCPVCGKTQWEQFEHQSQPLPGEIVNDFKLAVPYQRPMVNIVLDALLWVYIGAVVVGAAWGVYKYYRQGGFKLPEVSA